MAQIIKIHDKQFRKHISSAKVQKAVGKIAAGINRDFRNKKPIFIPVLNGAFMFSADLLKKIKIECEISFVKASSYSGTRSNEKVDNLIGLNLDIKGRDVIILEDIVDSGNTLENITKELQKHDPKRITTATLFFKPDAYKKKIKLDYIGMNVPNDFIVGYGLDYDRLGRNLKDVYVLK